VAVDYAARLKRAAAFGSEISDPLLFADMLSRWLELAADYRQEVEQIRTGGYPVTSAAPVY
jgi:hypothetical protein